MRHARPILTRAAAVALGPAAAACATLVATPAATQDVVERFQLEALSLSEIVEAPVALGFLAATDALPPPPERTVYRDDATGTYHAPDAAAAMPPSARAALTERALAPERYYLTKYGTPLAFARPLDVLGAAGVASLDGVRVLDFGYGTVGHLRLMARCGADAVGVDVDSFLSALYCEPGDQGPIAREDGSPGRVTLVDGYWPTAARTRVEVGLGYDVIVAKNTLKRGYIHPEREVDPRFLVHLGVGDETFVRSVHQALAPGGVFLIYNLSPAPSKPDEPYRPWADGRCPFDRSLLEAVGFEVVAYDVDDSTFARRMGRALGWDRGDGAMDLAHNLFARYTLVRRRQR